MYVTLKSMMKLKHLHFMEAIIFYDCSFNFEIVNQIPFNIILLLVNIFEMEREVVLTLLYRLHLQEFSIIKVVS